MYGQSHIHLFIAFGLLLLIVGAFVTARLRKLREAKSSERLSYEWKTVDLVSSSGEQLAKIDVRVADTPKKQYAGLSEAESLGVREGMLFVHDSENTQVYAMRDMSFPLDIIFIASDGQITAIHQAKCASEEPIPRFRGSGKYVLEVPFGTTGEIDLTEAGQVVIPGSVER